MTRSVEIPEAAIDAGAGVIDYDLRRHKSKADIARAVLGAALPYLVPATGAVVSPRDTCPHGDPACPCPDGDMCHYEGPDPMSAPAGTGGLREALAEQAGIWEGYTSDNPDVATGFELAAGKLRYLLAAHPAAPAGDGGFDDTGARTACSSPGLREALEQLANDYDYIPRFRIGEVLAAHPAAPAVPQPVDRPLLDRDALSQVLVTFGADVRLENAEPAVLLGRAVDAVMGLAQPVDREALRKAIEQALSFAKGALAMTHQNHGFDSACSVCRGKADEIAAAIVDDVLAVLAGE